MEKHLRQLSLKDIHITDSLFGEYVKKVSEKIIPHQWKILNDQLTDADPTYCIRNFRIAAGEEKGQRRGVVFQDTDLYKWLESVAYCLAAGAGRQYEALADETITLIGKAQEPDGYLNTYFTVSAPDRKWTNLVEGHELYTAGHMIEAAVAYYQATGKDKLLKIAEKNADLICKVFGTGEDQLHGYPGHQEIELALVKLYRVTKEKRYLETAHYFINERGKQPNYLMEEIKRRGGFEFFPEFADYTPEYSQTHKSPVEQETVEGHAVRAMYMCSAMADLAEECKDDKLKAACCKMWDNMVNRRMYLTGGIGSSGFCERFTTDYDLPNRINYSETCASIGVMMFGQRMTALTGNAAYYDAVELALYNTVLAGINMEGNRYFYVNPLEMVPEFCTEHTYMNHVKPVRQKWFSVACCPPNVARTLASLGQYIYAQEDEKPILYIHQFISSTARVVAGQEQERTMEVVMNSGLLQNGKIQIQVQAEGSWKLKIRIPPYAQNWGCTMDRKIQKAETQKGYLSLQLLPGKHEILLDLQVVPRWVAANNQVQEDTGKAALMKGPLVYCLEEIDNGRLLSQIYVEENVKVKEEAPNALLTGGIPTLCYEGSRVQNEGVSDHLYGSVKLHKEAAELKAVPYCLWNNRGVGEMLVWQKLKV